MMTRDKRAWFFFCYY